MAREEESLAVVVTTGLTGEDTGGLAAEAVAVVDEGFTFIAVSGDAGAFAAAAEEV